MKAPLEYKQITGNVRERNNYFKCPGVGDVGWVCVLEFGQLLHTARTQLCTHRPYPIATPLCSSLGQRSKTQSGLGLDSSQILLPGSSMLPVTYAVLS